MQVTLYEKEVTLIWVILQTIRLIRESENRPSRVCELSLHKDGSGPTPTPTWIQGKEWFEGKLHDFSGQTNVNSVSGYVYLQGAGKCPFTTRKTGGARLKVMVSKADTATIQYDYIEVGEFEL